MFVRVHSIHRECRLILILAFTPCKTTTNTIRFCAKQMILLVSVCLSCRLLCQRNCSVGVGLESDRGHRAMFVVKVPELCMSHRNNNNNNTKTTTWNKIQKQKQYHETIPRTININNNVRTKINNINNNNNNDM